MTDFDDGTCNSALRSSFHRFDERPPAGDDRSRCGLPRGHAIHGEAAAARRLQRFGLDQTRVHMRTPAEVNALAASPELKAAMARQVVDVEALRVARRVLEDLLIGFRDARVSVISAGNGFVVREPDGTDSDVIRLSTVDGLRIGFQAYLAALEAAQSERTD